MEAVSVGCGEVQGEFRGEWRSFCFGPNPIKTFKRVVVWCLGSLFFFNNMLLPIQIVGSSMTPTYRNGSLNFVNKLSYAAALPARGDVVALEAEGDLLLKRIVATPGDLVSICNGKVCVNGLELDDQFADGRIPWEMPATILGENEYFVIGDNRAASVFCKIHRTQILGKIMF
jgi:signal peptidase I